MKKYIIASLVVILTPILDQITKYLIVSRFAVGESLSIIPHFFNITFVTNRGGIFGIMSQGPDSLRLVVLKVLSIAICLYLVYLIIISRKNPFNFWCYTAILGGAIGNIYDRINLDYVVDFLDFYYKGHHFPAFNLADSVITVGIFILLIDSFIEWRKKR